VLGALSTITVSTIYLTAQMVGGGVLVKTLIGINYETSVACVGMLMLGYVVFGDVPDGWTLVGATIVIGSGLYILHRERIGRPRPPASGLKGAD